MVANLHLRRLHRRLFGRHHGRSDTHTTINGIFCVGRSTSSSMTYCFFCGIQRANDASSRLSVFDRFQQGLYGSFVGSLMYVFLGTCKEVPMGPTGIVALMTYNTLHGLGPVYGTLLCFLSGVIQLLMGVVGLGKRHTVHVDYCGLLKTPDGWSTGFLIDFISGPVNSGFTSAVAILIVASQIKDLIGVKAAGTTLADMVISISKDLNNLRIGDTTLGVICIVVILLLRVSEIIM